MQGNRIPLCASRCLVSASGPSLSTYTVQWIHVDADTLTIWCNETHGDADTLTIRCNETYGDADMLTIWCNETQGDADMLTVKTGPHTGSCSGPNLGETHM